MVALLDAAQIERVRLLGSFQEPQAIDVERAGAVKVAHAERDVACPHNVERGLQIRLTDRHAVGSALPPGKRRGFRPGEAGVVRSFAVDLRISVYMATRWAYCLPHPWGRGRPACSLLGEEGAGGTPAVPGRGV